jgi:hypothetical protein
LKKVLPIWFMIMVLAITAVAFSAERKSNLFVYNSFYDLMRGDLWDYIKDQQILLDLEPYPRNFVVIGLGNTNQSYSIGEMMATGTVGLPRFLWISPQYPNKAVEIWDREFPFAAVAVCNPKGGIQWEETGGEIHKVLSDRIEAEGVKVAALTMRGTLLDVQFHVSSHIPKEGIGAPRGTRDEGKRLKAFRIEGPSEWELYGLYLYSQELQLMASADGHPIRLHGYENNSKKGGHIDSAQIDRVSVRVYPIEEVKLFQNDLWIEDVKWNGGRIEIIVVNDGRMNLKHVTVETLFPERETWTVTIDRMEPMSKRFIEFIPSANLPEGTGWVVVDPNDEIKERREDNNRFRWPMRTVKSTGETHQ